MGLDQLLDPIRSAGLPVEAEVVGKPAAIPGDAELFAQRIITEALTNALRYAGPSPTRVRVEHTAGTVSVQVSDDGPGAGQRLAGGGAGLGIVGMRERAELLGGSLRAGVEGAGWTVRADLPRPAVLPAKDPA
ncbi:sensor histidine kinase [Fodinicola feengrottensis]|uniref:histidine kinase n=1 Tax=Fodinicola feengrottensis TaxID=435914 RepID=A0ABN2HUS5_9ACTN|nr:ATP-binding protein [Fodinicola feengrottensis]